jgi:N-methylhydantoinase A
LKRLYADFLEVHDRVYGYASEAPAGIVNLRSIHAAIGSDSLGEGPYEAGSPPALKGERTIRVAAEPGGIAAQIYDRANLPVAFRFAGPAIVEQADTTTVIEPGWQGEVLADGNLVLTADTEGT